MRKLSDEAYKLRAIATETLPYEVPVIFSNDALMRCFDRPSSNSFVMSAIKKIYHQHSNFTIPYSYTIRKDRNNTTTLGIIHPRTQLEIARFYDKHFNAILSYCSRSTFSLRYPAYVASDFYSKPIIDKYSAELKSGIPLHESSEALDGSSHLASYFGYERYVLLGKFVESPEYTSLEKRFARLRTLDVTKCFLNIYTHSITWAVKDKDFAKENIYSFSFEAEFDKLMQRANYNETNGIVIGPEVSRIFAEIIMQSVDRSVREQLDRDGKKEDSDYAIRMYVDDFFVFANSDELLDLIESRIRKELERYKLFVNESKVGTFGRPFVSKLSLARSEIRDVVGELWDVFADESLSAVANIRVRERSLRRSIRKIRFIVSKFGVEFGNISGWLLIAIRNLLRRTLPALSATKDKPEGEKDREGFVKCVISLLEVSFYICAVDLRVRSTYALCQIVFLTQSIAKEWPSEYEQFEHVIARELVNIIDIASIRMESHHFSRDPVELYNLLICGAHLIGEEFVSNRIVMDVIRSFVGDNITYFGYIATKFCLLRSQTQHAKTLRDELNDRVRDRLLRNPRAINKCTESFLMLCDYLSAPDVAAAERRAVFQAAFGGKVSNVTLVELRKYVGFADWSGLRVRHLLARKELRPVYSWA